MFTIHFFQTQLFSPDEFRFSNKGSFIFTYFVMYSFISATDVSRDKSDSFLEYRQDCKININLSRALAFNRMPYIILMAVKDVQNSFFNKHLFLGSISLLHQITVSSVVSLFSVSLIDSNSPIARLPFPKIFHNFVFLVLNSVTLHRIQNKSQNSLTWHFRLCFGSNQLINFDSNCCLSPILSHIISLSLTLKHLAFTISKLLFTSFF